MDGSPAVGMRVALMAVNENGVADPATARLTNFGQTNTQGQYHLENIPPGRYFVVTARSLESRNYYYYPGVKAQREARIIPVATAQTVTNIDFTLDRPAAVRVSGRVRNLPSALPAGGVQAVLQHLERANVPILEAPLSADGSFEWAKVPPGPYRMHVTIANTPITRIDIDDKDIDGIEVSIGLTVSGRGTMDDGSALPVVAGFQGPYVLFRLSASPPGIASPIATRTPPGWEL
jgi:hypothetical protein